jgi:hypothetical protein
MDTSVHQKELIAFSEPVTAMPEVRKKTFRTQLDSLGHYPFSIDRKLFLTCFF